MPLNSKRPPPPPTGSEKESAPPPIPSRPQAQRPVYPQANNPPSPPDCSPPELPKRPVRNNQPVLQNYDFYEDVNASHHISATSSHHCQLGWDDSGKKLPPKPKVKVRTWDSFNGAGNKLLTYQNKQRKTISDGERKRRAKFGPADKPNPEMLEDTDQTDYEVPSSLNLNAGVDPHSMSNSDSSVEDWSDSEWDNHDNAKAGEPGDEIYEIPQENENHLNAEEPGDEIYELPQENENHLVQDDEYISPDECDIPKHHAERKNMGPAVINIADIHMTRMKLVQSTPKSSTAVNDKPKTAVMSTTSSSSSAKSSNFTADKNMFKSKNTFSSRPTPPPKPKAAVKMSSEAVSNNSVSGSSNTTDKDKKKRDSRSDDNLSAGSLSSIKETQSTNNKKKDKTAMLPKTLMTLSKNDKGDAGPSPRKTSSSHVPETKFNSEVESYDPSDLYDDAVSLSENLTKYDWFHGDINRKEGERRVQSVGKIGTFLIRTCSGNTRAQDGNRYPYTLVIKTKDEVKNLRIRQRQDNNFALGTTERADEICFPSMCELVQHHRVENVKIFGQDEVVNQDEVLKLLTTPKKS